MKKIISSASLLALLLVAGALWWLSVDISNFMQQPLNLQSRTIFTINKGTTLTAIGDELGARGWLSKPVYLIIEGRRRQLSGAIKAGEYELNPGLTPAGLLELIVSGKVVQYSLTIPEGWTFFRIMQAVASSTALIKTLPESSPEHVMAAIGHPEEPAEGMFFPETYHFPAATTDVDFLRRSYDLMAKALVEEWQQRDMGLPYKTPYEALIMASIIEKETAIAEERGRIAGVFVRRLQRGMKLQTDPTVIYAIGAGYDGDIRHTDLKLDSPYNTYMYRGLPPTPIASPGRASIKAALQPEPGSALYFVAMGDGRHYFSETLVEHNRAVARYQLNK
jgi:UPF0755 protein